MDVESTNKAPATSGTFCYVCNSRTTIIRNTVQIFGDQAVLPHTKTRLKDTIEKITQKPVVNMKPPPVVCRKCFKQFEEYDDLMARMSDIKSDIHVQFKKTVKNSPSVTVPKIKTPENKTLENKTAVKSKPLSELATTSTIPVIIKKQVAPSVNPQKKIPVISMKKVTKLPSNFVVVNQKGKIAVQNLEKPISKDSSNGGSKLEKLLTQNPSNTTPKGEVKIRNVFSTNTNTNKSVLNTSRSSSNDFVKSVKQEIADANDTSTEDDMEIEELTTVEELDEDQEDGEVQDDAMDEGNFVISHMEILNDPNAMDLEEGTILVEQEPDGTIRLLRHAGDLYEGDYESTEELDPSDDDTEDNRNTDDDEEVSKKSKVLKIKLGRASSTARRKTSEETTFDHLAIVSRVDDKLFKCLLCKEKNVERDMKEVNNVSKEDSEKCEESDSVEKSKETDSKSNSSEDKEKKNEEADSAKYKEKVVGELKDDDSGEFQGSCKEITLHMRLVHNFTIHLCQVCGEAFPKRSQLNNHLDKHVLDGVTISEYCCVSCSAVFDNLKAFRIHTKFEHREMTQKHHICTVCNRKFNSKKLLEEHNNMHIGVKPYTCELCGKSFTSKYTYQSHCKTHTDRPRPYSCSQCGKSFFTLQNKTQHEKTHLGIKDFVCNVCGKAFGTQHNLDVHGVVHTGFKPYECWICKKAFARRAEIRDHERTHTGERPYACEICGATFSQRSNLQSHKRATHYDDKRYKCRNCDKSFKRRRLLEYHIKSSHTGERPYKCNVCEATFVYPEHYKKHTRIHSGEKPYSCEVCGKAFNSRDNRNAHRFIHSDKKPYECLDCGAGFMRKPLLYAHMQQQGHLNDTIIVNQPRITGDYDGKLNHLEGTFILEDGQEVIINNIKEEVLADGQLDNKITLTSVSNADDLFETEFVEEGGSKLSVRARPGMKHDAIIVQTEDDDLDNVAEVEAGEIGGVEEGETTIITGGMIDSQSIHIIETSDQQDGQTFQVEDGSVRFFQIRLPNGEDGWVALNNTEEDSQ